MQLHFLTFGGPTESYRAAVHRIRDEAQQMNVFSSITALQSCNRTRHFGKNTAILSSRILGAMVTGSGSPTWFSKNSWKYRMATSFCTPTLEHRHDQSVFNSAVSTTMRWNLRTTKSKILSGTVEPETGRVLLLKNLTKLYVLLYMWVQENMLFDCLILKKWKGKKLPK
jgi:hypothetical protein